LLRADSPLPWRDRSKIYTSGILRWGNGARTLADVWQVPSCRQLCLAGSPRIGSEQLKRSLQVNGKVYQLIVKSTD
jgi:hypothetical protein